MLRNLTQDMFSIIQDTLVRESQYSDALADHIRVGFDRDAIARSDHALGRRTQ